MTPDSWKRIRELFDAALGRPESERAAFLDEAAGGDAELRAEVEALLVSFAESSGFLANGPLAVGPAGGAMEGRRIGPYRILHRLGTGGMGAVYAAARDDQQYRKMVAIKLVHPSLDSGAIRQRFLNERQVLAGLDHPQIARLLDGGATEDGLPYLVMEYVEGTPIDRYCEQHRLRVEQRLRLFLQVCDAVQYAHQNLVVHRDLKPANILVTAEGQPKLLDFGVAKLLRPELTAQTMAPTRPGLTPLTLEYASPEQLRGEPVTTASDVYSLGVLLYLLLTGGSPYRPANASPQEWITAVCDTEPDPPSQAARRQDVDGRGAETKRRLTGDLDVILLMALRKDPDQRYPSAERFALDIRRHLDGLPVSARRMTPVYRARKFVTRNKLPVAAATVAVVALLGSTYVAQRERAISEHRFEQVRALSRFFIQDLDDTIQSGQTAARKVVVDKGLTYLNSLAEEYQDDPSLQRELIDGYLKIGDLQGNFYGPNLGDAAGAGESYESALRIARDLAASQPDNGAFQRDIARANIRLGDLAAYGGDRRRALEYYGEALAASSSAAVADEAAPERMRIHLKTGSVYYQLGNYPAALASYRASLELASSLLAGNPGSMASRKDHALSLERVGDVLVRTGHADEGFEKMRQALATYRQLAAEHPENNPLRRDVTAASTLLGDALAEGGRIEEAVVQYRSAASVAAALARDDPRNIQYQRDLYLALGRLADKLPRVGRMDDARRSTVRALEVLRPLVDLPDATSYDLQQYVWLLVTTPFADLRNPRAALPYAERAVRLTKESDPGTLDALARAQFGSGRRAAAVATEEKALGLLPAGAASSLRTELEENLRRFREARPE